MILKYVQILRVIHSTDFECFGKNIPSSNPNQQYVQPESHIHKYI